MGVCSSVWLGKWNLEAGTCLGNATCFGFLKDFILVSHFEVLSCFAHVYYKFKVLYLPQICFRIYKETWYREL